MLCMLCMQQPRRSSNWIFRIFWTALASQNEITWKHFLYLYNFDCCQSYIMIIHHLEFKEALDNIFNFSFWLNCTYQFFDYLFTNTKRIFKNFFCKRRSRQILLSMHKVGMRLICIHVTVQNMVILNQNVIICIISTRYVLYLFKELHKQGSELVDGAKFNSQIQKSIFKNGCTFIHLCNQVEIASKIKHAVTT